MLVASTFWKPADTDWLLGAAVSCAQSLRLNSLACLKIVCQTSEDVELLNHAFWLLYIIEKPFRLRNGQASALNDAYIDHEPISSDIRARKPPMQTIGVRYRLAQYCARIADEFDIQKAQSRSTVFTLENTSTHHDMGLESRLTQQPKYHALSRGHLNKPAVL
ncbi:hypothetical protein BDP55DRAFT_389834 [Colletotrichum godetiae]|uniref:Uncharacterized protein n=1 Tax=Colletotrichum godetiae TaxID=1209918 RepID=A0AAJ0A8Y5_9PEZI|nr:uncharacterized protein BDP55DRAFT_389834 [Colletotrichum godetiae]KAK1658700.1 hypothetical protein BDP55DRAFT_389834 [Colletotrichum godetiae]